MEANQTLTGYRHTDSCLCGCHVVIGSEGRLVENSDTPKLAELGLGIYRFTDRVGQEVTVAYDLEAKS